MAAGISHPDAVPGASQVGSMGDRQRQSLSAVMTPGSTEGAAVEGSPKKKSALAEKYPKTVKEIVDFAYAELGRDDDELKDTTKDYLQTTVVDPLNEAEKLLRSNKTKEAEASLGSARSAARLEQLLQRQKVPGEERKPPAQVHRVVYGENGWSIVTEKTSPKKK